MANFEDIKKQLADRYYFMNDNWLRDCLSYVLTEYPNENQGSILLMIIHQWLLCDLRKINSERSILPNNIQQQKFITLSGNYILQVEKAYDVSTSKYKQLEKIRNVSVENIEATEEEKNFPTDIKGKRMINLYLSDGVQNVIAMEYSPIRSLNEVVPGIKVMIKGPVACRRGVILLEEKNLSIIGGEIESLLITNATENVLARALNLPENPDPYGTNNKADEEQELFDDNMDVDLEAIAHIEKLNESMSSLSASNLSKSMLNKIPMIPVKKQESVMLNELPVCFEQKKQDVSQIDGDDDDEWIGMIDESNIEEVKKQSGETNSELAPHEYASDIEFCDFEADDFTEYGSSSSTKNENKSKPRAVETSATIPLNVTSNKSTKQPSSTLTTQKPSTLAATSKIYSPTKSSPKSHISLSIQPSKIPKKPQTLKSEASSSKITDFLKKSDVKEKQSTSANQMYCSISDIKEIIPVKELVHKTIKAMTKTLQKLTKQDSNWYLEGAVTDGEDCIDVIFSSDVLEKLIGFNFNEFSQRKKLQKTDPKIKDELRQALRNTESVLIRMNAYLKLELIPNESKPKIICITEVIEEQKFQR